MRRALGVGACRRPLIRNQRLPPDHPVPAAPTPGASDVGEFLMLGDLLTERAGELVHLGQPRFRDYGLGEHRHVDGPGFAGHSIPTPSILRLGGSFVNQDGCQRKYTTTK